MTAPLRRLGIRRPLWGRRSRPGGAGGPGRRRLLAGLVGAIVALGVVVGGLAQVELSTEIDSFVPASDPVVDQLSEFGRTFGADPAVVLLESSQPGGLLEPEQLSRLLRLEGQLKQMPDVAAVYGPATVLNQIAGQAQDMVAELAGRREGLRRTAEVEARNAGLPAPEVARAVDAASAQFDERYGSMLVKAMPAGLPTLGNPRFARTVLLTPENTPRPQWRFVTPTAQSVAVLVRPRADLDQAGNEALVANARAAVDRSGLTTSRVTISGAPGVVAGLGEQVRQEVPLVGGVALIAVALCFWLTPWARRRRRLLPVAVTLLATATTVAALGWLGRPLSLGVVAFLPVLLGVGSYYPTYFAHRSRRGVVAVVALATACAFGALAFSPLPFVRDLGLALGIGVLAACGIGALVMRPERETPAAEVPAPRTHDASFVPARHEIAPAPPLCNRVIALAVAVVLAGLGWAGLASAPLKTEFSSFTQGLDVGADLDHIARMMGTSGEVDLVLRGPDVASPEAMAWMRQAQDTIVARHGDVLRPATTPPSLFDFLGTQPTAEQIDAALRLTPPYLVGSVMPGNHKVAGMAFGTSVTDAEALQRLRDDVLAEIPPAPAGYTVELTGLPMLAARGQELVSSDRYLANAVGVVAAGLVLALGLRRRRSDAGRAVLAAVLATGTGFAVVWLFGLELNPVTISLGALTSAVGCEFTVMLAESHRLGHRWLRKSVTLAAVTSAVGYSALAVSGLGALREFGLMLAGSVVLALLAARFVLWSWPVDRTSEPDDGPVRDADAGDVPEVSGSARSADDVVTTGGRR